VELSHLFQARKAAALERLVGDHGILRSDGIVWLESDEGAAADLPDLRLDPNFWENDYRYALEEHQAGDRPL
jgi:hypothetical protein